MESIEENADMSDRPSVAPKAQIIGMILEMTRCAENSDSPGSAGN